MPYRNGGGLFVGKSRDLSPGFPFATGPVCHVSGRHDDNDIIPLKVILNWLHRLCLTDKDVTEFWAITDHEQSDEGSQLL